MMEQWKLALVVGTLVLGGVGLGAALFRAPAAEAQTAGYRECMVARQESLDTNDSGEVQTPSAARVIRVPPGWQPVGGAGLFNNWVAGVVFCR